MDENNEYKLYIPTNVKTNEQIIGTNLVPPKNDNTCGNSIL